MSQVYVGRLNPRVSDKTIEEEFSIYKSVRVSRKSPNYAFVDFDHPNDALEAIRNLDGRHGWKVKPSYNSKRCSECGELGHFAPDCRLVIPSRKIDVKNKCNPRGQQRRFRGNKYNRDGNQSNIGVSEVPDSQKSNQENLETGPVGIEPEKSSIDESPILRGDCNFATPSQINDSSSSISYEQIKSVLGFGKEPNHKLQIRENITQSRVVVDKGPVSQQRNQDNIESKPIEPEKPSIDELASKLEEKVRELGAVNAENENLKHKLNEANAEITSAKAKEEEMNFKLKKLGEQLEDTSNRLTFSKAKGEDMIFMLKKVKAELLKSNYDASSAKAKEFEMSMKLKKVQDELEKVNSMTSSAKNKEEEMSVKLKKLEEQLRKSEKYGVQLNDKLKEVEGVKETLQAEIKNINEKAEEWRRTADAASAIFSMGVEINTEVSESKPLFSWYMNRADMNLSLQRVRESLLYLRMAAILDPNSLETHLMSAERHLTLGEVEDAVYYYNKCSKSGSMSCFDRRVTIEAANGIQKAQKLDSCIKHSSELLLQRTFCSATEALEVISEAMSISPSSEKLLELQGEALFVLRKYEEVVQLCERTLYFAEMNFAIIGVANQEKNVDGKNISKLWRWNLMSKSYFHWGRLDMALNFIEKQEILRSNKVEIEESMSPLAATVRELLHCKEEGNEAFQSGRYTEAVKHYTNAISTSTESRPFSAVCLSNRAAACQALNKITDAIADCNLALALDGSYHKALFRRAKLHEKIRDYERSVSDFKRFISVFEKQTPGRQAIEARLRLSCIEEKAKRGTTMNLYLILGVNASDSALEIKKAYRRAALSHHPDKAGVFLARSDSGYDGQLWKDISKTISMDANELFIIIGEAYSVLSDLRKRSRYDIGEMMRDDKEEGS